MSDWREMLEADVLTLGMAADTVRRAAPGGTVVTYLRVHEVTPRELGEGQRDALASGVGAGASELRLYAAPDTHEEAVAQVRAMKAVAGARRVVAFCWLDLQERGWTERARLSALVEAGLQDVAELPADLIEDLPGAVENLIAAGITPQRVSVARPTGDRRVEMIQRVQRTFAAQPSLRRFSPLPREAPVDKPTTGYDDVRMVAIARLALGDRSIEVDWQRYGPKLAQVALTFGADHLDAVGGVDDQSLGARRTTLEDVERNIRAAGFEPQEYRA